MTRRVELRRLELRDLNAIEEIERALVPDAVVALDVRGRARQAVVALPRRLRRGDGRLVGYLIISRYVDAWHVMNVAVAPSTAARGIASQLLERLFELTAGRRRAAATRSRCASRTPGRSSSTSGSASAPRGVRRGYYTDNREDALIMWRDPVPEAAAAAA